MIALSKLCCAPRRLHPDLESRVSALTVSRYRKAIQPFVQFLIESELFDITSEEQFDNAVGDFRDAANLSRTQHTCLVAAVEFVLPRLKGGLIEARRHLKGRQATAIVDHTVPMTKPCATLMACHMSHMGQTQNGSRVVCTKGHRLKAFRITGDFT